MPNLFARGDAMLSRMAQAAAGETVRVLRGSNLLADAWEVFPGTTRIEVLTDGELTIVGDRHDWIGDPSQIRDSEGYVTSLQQGDTCEWVVGEYVLTFEAQPADGENVSSPHGPTRSRIRSHWKLKDTRLNE